MLHMFITISAIILLWLILVYGGFYLFYGLKMIKPNAAGVWVRVLNLLFIALAGVYFLFFSPGMVRPVYGDTVFIIAVVIIIFLFILLGILTLSAVFRRK